MAPSDLPDGATDAIPVPQPNAARRRTLGVSLAVAGVLLFGLLLFRVAGPRPVPPPKVIAYTPRQAEDARKDLDALSAQLLTPPPPEKAVPAAPKADTPAAPIAMPPARSAPVRLQLSQSDLNTYLATDPKVKALLAARGIQAVQLILREPHNVTCRAAVLYKGHRTNVQIAGALVPSPDKLARFVATSAQIGTLPVPPKVVSAQADRIVARFLGRIQGRVPVVVQDIRVVGDRLVVSGVRRPKK